MRGASLSSRLLVGLVAAQLCAVLAAMLLFPLLSPFVALSDVADLGFRTRLVEGLRRSDKGELTLVPTPALESYLRRRPRLRFAVRSPGDGQILSGSDPRLARLLEAFGDAYPKPSGNLGTALGDGSTGLVVTAQPMPFGLIVVAAEGNEFHAEDLPALVASFLPALLPAYGPVLFGALVLLPLVVRLVTRPLRRISQDAATIGPASLDKRLDTAGLSPELQALASAINEALARLAEGFARQRLYAANAAHELRTPLAILSLHVEELPDSEQKIRLAADTARIRGLVEQLIAVARLGQQQASLEKPVDVAEVAREVVADRAPLAIRSRRQIEFSSAAPRWIVRGNRPALFSAIANVLDNAIRAEPEGGTVALALSAEGRLDVIDHGRGFDAEEAQRAFDPFWRRSDDTPGAGLGLAIVKEIADRHGVAVRILPTEGGGATVQFDFGRRGA